MITAVRKPFAEIQELISGCRKVLVLGCGSCVTVCMAGGEKEVEILASTLRLARGVQKTEIELREAVIERQCDREFFEAVKEDAAWADAVLSLACGVGVQLCSDLFPGKMTFPGLNTRFYAVTEAQGIWSERCAGCGACVVHRFGGICPLARCAKNLLNGPCGGSKNGKCEVSPESNDCAWQLIYERMEGTGRLERLEEIEPIRNWDSGRDGGPGKIIKEDMLL